MSRSDVPLRRSGHPGPQHGSHPGHDPGSRRGVLSRRAGLVAAAQVVGLVAVQRAAASAAVPGVLTRSPRAFGVAVAGSSVAGLRTALSLGTSLHRAISVVGIYQAWGFRLSFPTAFATAAQAAGVLPSITWEPWMPGQGSHQPDFRLRAIAAGRYDTYLKSWAGQARRFGQPFLLRFAHEMNGHWYPWGARVNGNTPADYVAAFRHVRSVFRSVGVTNARWVWSPQTPLGTRGDVALSSVFPGLDAVDVVGLDGYNIGRTVSSGNWASPRLVFGSGIAAVTPLRGNRPLWITEVGCAATDLAVRATWAQDLFDYLKGTAVAGAVWFEVDDRAGGVNWQIRPAAPVLSAVRSSLSGW